MPSLRSKRFRTSSSGTLGREHKKRNDGGGGGERSITIAAALYVQKVSTVHKKRIKPSCFFGRYSWILSYNHRLTSTSLLYNLFHGLQTVRDPRSERYFFQLERNVLAEAKYRPYYKRRINCISTKVSDDSELFKFIRSPRVTDGFAALLSLSIGDLQGILQVGPVYKERESYTCARVTIASGLKLA